MSIFEIGVSGLNAAQAALATTSHNISNAATAGYHRQTALTGTQNPQETGSGFFGKGVRVETVMRSYSSFLDGAVRQAQSQESYLQTYNSQISQIDNLLADPSSGLSPALQSFFSAVQDVASNPSAVPSRQAMISQAEALVSRFQAFSARFGEIRNGVNREIADTTTAINSLSGQISRLNLEIMQAQSSETKPPNDLLDRRDELIGDLNKLVRTSVVSDASGMVNVFIGTGQSLVIGAQAFSLTATQSPSDPSNYDVSYVANGNTVPISPSTLQGGSLGGLLAFRSQTLDSVQNSIGRVAIGLAQTFNDQHRLGQDYNGALGQNFFNVPAAQAIVNANNSSTAVLSASITDVDALTTSDYRLTFNAGTWTVNRLSDGTQSTFAAFPQVIDGVTINIASGPAANGDSFLIQPTRTGARDLDVAISNPALVAAAAPIRSASATGNTGNATITAGTVNAPPPTNANLQNPVTVTFTAANTFNVTGAGTGNPVGVAYTPGGDITYNGWTVQINGTPAPGDTFTIGPNTNGVADNRNALLLTGLQTTSTLVNGSATYQSAYSMMVSDVGNRAREIQVQGKAQTALVQQTTEAQQSLSGVNLDEEAANLIRFQQAYQASGRVLQIASTLFDTILGIGA